MGTKDFNILAKKVSSNNNKKDISFVTDYNSYVQKIENVCRLQKNEIPSSVYMGVDYYDFLFNPVSNKNIMEQIIENNILNAVYDIRNVTVEIVNYTESSLTLKVIFTPSKLINQNPTTCQIEVSLL